MKKRTLPAALAAAAVVIVALLACATPVPAAPAVAAPAAAPAKPVTAAPADSPKDTAPVAAAAPKDVAKPAELPDILPSIAKPNAFAAENLGTIASRKLANGLTLVVKRSPASKVVAAKIALLGQSAFARPEDAGLEALTLAMMARGTAKVGYDDLKKLLYDKTSSISTSAEHFDLTSFDLVTLGKYFGDLFPVFADCFVNPAFDPEQWKKVLSEFKVAYKKSMSDPYTAATAMLHEGFFAGHPYAAEFLGTELSLEGMTLDKVKEYAATRIGPERMAVIVVGDVDPVATMSELESRFAYLAPKGLVAAEPAPLAARAGLLKETHPSAEGVAYVRGDFPMPRASSREFYPAALGMSVLSDLVSDAVRTRHGACYSAWASYKPFRAGYGSIGVYRTETPGEVRAYVDEALAALLDGKALAPDGSGYAPLASVLDSYKAKFVTDLFSKQQSNLAIAQQLALSLVLYGDLSEYLLLQDRLDAVSADDVLKAARKWLAGVDASWIVLGDEALLATVKDEAYLKPLGK